MLKTHYNDTEDLLIHVRDFLYWLSGQIEYSGTANSIVLEGAALELSTMLRARKYVRTKLLSLGDFVCTSPTRFGCPFGEVTEVSRFGDDFGPDWVRITWFKWNYVPFLERDETNVIKEIAHRRNDKPAYELALTKMLPVEMVRRVSELKPWREQMELEQNKGGYGCVTCRKPLPIVYGLTFCSPYCAAEYFKKEIDND